MHPIAQRKLYCHNESPNVKTKAEQSFCYAPKEESGCIFSKRFSGVFLLRQWRRRKKAGMIHISGCICRFALGFCRNKKERTETLYQSFSPFMWNDSRNDTIHGFHLALGLSFCNGCIWVQELVLGCKTGSVDANRAFVLPSIIQYSQFAIMSIPLWRVAASIAPTACAITCPSALMKKEVGKE